MSGRGALASPRRAVDVPGGKGPRLCTFTNMQVLGTALESQTHLLGMLAAVTASVDLAFWGET